MSQRPAAIRLQLCEQMVVEEDTKNVTLVNCFTQRIGETFPWTSPPIVVVAWLTDGAGEVVLEVIVEQADSLEELFRKEVRFRFTSPLQQGRLSLRLNSLTFPTPGTYRVVLLAESELIAQRKLFVVLKETSHE